MYLYGWTTLLLLWWVFWWRDLWSSKYSRHHPWHAARWDMYYIWWYRPYHFWWCAVPVHGPLHLHTRKDLLTVWNTALFRCGSGHWGGWGLNCDNCEAGHCDLRGPSDIPGEKAEPLGCGEFLTPKVTSKTSIPKNREYHISKSTFCTYSYISKPVVK